MKLHNATWLFVVLCFMLTLKNSFGRTVGLDRFKNDNSLLNHIFHNPPEICGDETCEEYEECQEGSGGTKTCECVTGYTKKKKEDVCKEICDKVCEEHEECKRGSDGTETCECVTGYTKKEGVCEETCDKVCEEHEECKRGSDATETCECVTGYTKKEGVCEVVTETCDKVCEDHEECKRGSDGTETCECVTGYTKKEGVCEEICDKVCVEHEECKKGSDGTETCECVTGYIKKEGVCEEICNKECGAHEECKKESDGTETCECVTGFTRKEDACQACDCGKNSVKCSWEDEAEEPTCICKTTFAVKDGKCEACSLKCGEGKCEFGEESVEICNCKAEYYFKPSQKTCKKCSLKCGKGKCEFDATEDKETCTCDEGYEFKETKCIKTCTLHCGESGTCKIIKGDKETCDCKAGFVFKDETCEECGCGEHSTGCTWNKDEEHIICNCKTGYGQKGGSCEECKLPCKYGKCAINDDNEEICKCNAKYYFYSNDTTNICADCKCGTYSTGCTLIDGAIICECNEGYAHKGTRCETCPLNCGTGGTCYFKETEQNGKKVTQQSCDCKEGFALRNNTCKDKNPCKENPCHPDHGKCDVTENLDFKCICNKGYDEGTNCKNITWCIENKDCKNCEFDSKSETGFCKCADANQYYDLAEKKCTKITNKCAGITCGANQECKDGKCNCIGNYNMVEKKCEWIQTNCEKLCGKGSNCEANPQDPTKAICICGKQFYFDGKKCQSAICKVQSLSGCSQYCNIEKDEPVCSCQKSGFKLAEDQKTCVLDETKTCDHEKQKCDIGNCIKESGEKFSCICPTGYKQASKIKCELDTKALCLGQPANKNNNKTCNCTGKFKLAANGVMCEKRDMCQDEEFIKECAERNAICVDTDNGYDCACADGYVKDPSNNGTCTALCEFKEIFKECTKDNKECYLKQGKNGKLEAACKCPATFIGTEGCTQLAQHSYIMESLPIAEKAFAKDQGNVKLQTEIYEAMRVLFPTLLSATVLDCKKNSGVLSCSSELQFPEELKYDEKKRLHAPGSCLDLEGLDDGICVLPPNLPLNKAKIDDVSIDVTKRCSDAVKSEICGTYAFCSEDTKLNTFTCSCQKGYRTLRRQTAGDSVIALCEDIDECITGHSCGNNTMCVNTIGNYHCKCNAGYIKPKGKESIENNKDGCIGVCHEGACSHGTCKVADNFEKDCSCKPGYGGSYCNRADAHYAEARKSTVVTAAVLGTLLGVAVIVFFIAVRKLRKHKYSQDFSPASARPADGAEMTERRQLRQGVSNRAYQ